MTFKRSSPKVMVSSIDDMTAARRYHHCKHCQRGVTPLDAWAGFESDHLTPHGRRLIVLAGSDHSFDIASDRLQRMCGVRVSDQTVRRACEALGKANKPMCGPGSSVRRYSAKGHIAT